MPLGGALVSRKPARAGASNALVARFSGGELRLPGPSVKGGRAEAIEERLADVVGLWIYEWMNRNSYGGLVGRCPFLVFVIHI